MDTQAKPGQIVFTNKARCRDCNRCVRVCPVKAIRVVRGQASVEDHLCIACGTCIRECPQGAKTFRNDVDRAARIVKAYQEGYQSRVGAGPVHIEDRDRRAR